MTSSRGDSPPCLDDFEDSFDSISIRKLQRELAEKDSTISQLELEIEALLTNHHESSVTSKVADLIKRNRSLQLALEQERNAHKLTQSQATKPSPPSSAPSSSNDNSTMQVRRDFQAKMNRALSKIGDLTTQLEKQKSENIKLVKILSRELGDVSLDSLLNDERPTWKGRAQTIMSLKHQIMNLKQKLGDEEDNPNPNPNSNPNRNRELEVYAKVREKVKKEVEQEMESLTCNYNQERHRLKATLARVSVLEKELADLKGHLQQVVTKTKNDNRYIQALKKEISKQSKLIGDEGHSDLINELESTKERLSIMEKKYGTLTKELEVTRVTATSQSTEVLERELTSLNKLCDDLRNRLVGAEKDKADALYELRKLVVQHGIEGAIDGVGDDEYDFERSTSNSVLLEKRLGLLENELKIYKEIIQDFNEYLLNNNDERDALYSKSKTQLMDLQIKYNELVQNYQ
ncbi:hypothetical protein P9112_011524 [Eukaryota sp. TZLM1-RC]